MKLSRNLIVTLGVLGVLVVAGLSLYGYANRLRDQGVVLENGLNAEYLDAQNYLSSYISGFYEEFGALEFNRAAIEPVLMAAAKGEFDGKPQLLVAAVMKAFPEKSIESFNANVSKFMDYIAAGRVEYRNKQSKLLDLLRTYDTWRQKGLTRSLLIRMFLGYPTDRLVARIGDIRISGKAALDQMYTIVLTEQAVDAYKSGRMEPLAIPTMAR